MTAEVRAFEPSRVEICLKPLDSEWSYEDEAVVCIIKGPRELSRNVHYDGLCLQVFIENGGNDVHYQRFEIRISEVLKTCISMEEFPMQQLHIILTIKSSSPDARLPLYLFINAAVTGLLTHGIPMKQYILAAPLTDGTIACIVNHAHSHDLIQAINQVLQNGHGASHILDQVQVVMLMTNASPSDENDVLQGILHLHTLDLALRNQFQHLANRLIALAETNF
ncbi:hypothetical protein GNI_107450 [Gregarina niphandrodes]|uniref:Uncharacterized protein n=1 Tax=Gregarina niphandrodes TaxID=110365 RepID=A0A023B427_GRENI|nr:hypothetical protein GNI_107450 [Gregarina niphandrodes]EZG55912.1 hypothetical protein GNI_107450 [Gregarina niphandrodes]|eukprot:XP_011131419.1 hypothetical protein GNI_107450 [Gregarina niphandrodes]